MKHHRSAELYQRAQEVLAGGVSSQFRSYDHPHPLFYESGRGSRITDVDGNTYLDFTLSQGPLILGHSRPEVVEAVARATASGQIFAGQHIAELELAETMQRLVPCADLVRFSLSGSEAVHAALRAARVHTGRTRFVKFEGHYHGWFDNVAVSVSAPSADALGSRLRPRPLPWTQGRPLSLGRRSDHGVLERSRRGGKGVGVRSRRNSGGDHRAGDVQQRLHPSHRGLLGGIAFSLLLLSGRC